jgi:hypothetical protein|tara:strand:+ start:2918 stop:3118 length:201 start_codon:yes stop_codon:yes gene_type:complete
MTLINFLKLRNNVLDAHYVINILKIPSDCEELKEMITTLDMYFTHYIDFIIKNITDYINKELTNLF